MHTCDTRRAGFTLVEVVFTSSVLAVMMLAVLGIVRKDSDLAQSTLSASAAETKAQQMLHALERELADARGANPLAVITNTLGAGDTASLRVDSTLGFPDEGMLLVARGTGSVERIRYGGLDAGSTEFHDLARGQQCTDAATHSTGIEILWGGLAEPIALQSSPPANLWDGRALEATGPVFFRGDGSGFSYRLPTDPTGGTEFIEDGELRWGSDVGGVPTLTGWSALYFAPVSTVAEADIDHDLNGDRDRVDTFDVGQIRRRAWDTANPATLTSLAMGPTIVLQERCNWGGDLDGDGFDDPIFLWDAETRRLHVRLFVLGTPGTNAQRQPIRRTVETMIFLRNEAQE